MIPGRGSDSLRAVLLGARTGSGSGSKPGSSAVTWHSLRSGVKTKDPPGHFFPAKLAMSTGLVKIFFSVLMVLLGGVALNINAPMASLGAGIWVGIVVGVSGFLGVCAARRPYAQVYVISFMSVSILSMAASGLLVVLSATSWARGSQTKEMVLFDKETQSEVDLFGEILLKNPSILVSGFLVVLGILDILTSLACVALSAREACGSSASTMGVFTVHEGHDKKERLYKWLGQQKNIFQVGSSAPAPKTAAAPQFVTLTSSGQTSPRRKNSSPLTQSTEPLLRPVLVNQKRLEPLSSATQTKTKKQSRTSQSSSGVSSENRNSSVLFLQPELSPVEKAKRRKKESSGLYSLPQMPEPTYFINAPGPYPNNYAYAPIYQRHHEVNKAPYPSGYHSLPCPQHSYPKPPPPLLYYVPPMPHYGAPHEISAKRVSADKRNNAHLYSQTMRASDTEKRKRRKERKKRKEAREKRRNQPMTDEQIENSYTGLDRQIAEGFINLTMEPSLSQRKGTFSDQESY